METIKIRRMLRVARFYTPIIKRAITIYGDDFVFKLAQHCINLYKHQKSQTPLVRAIFMWKLKQLPESAQIFMPKHQLLPTISEEEEAILMETA